MHCIHLQFIGIRLIQIVSLINDINILVGAMRPFEIIQNKKVKKVWTNNAW